MVEVVYVDDDSPLPKGMVPEGKKHKNQEDEGEGEEEEKVEEDEKVVMNLQQGSTSQDMYDVDESLSASAAASLSAPAAAAAAAATVPVRNNGTTTTTTTIQEIEVVDRGLLIDFLNDKRQHMTFGRQLALYLSRNYKWYNPHLGVVTTTPAAAAAAAQTVDGTSNDDNNNDDTSQQAQSPQPPPPSLDKAWAFFEHVTLARYEVVASRNLQEKQKSQQQLQKFTTTQRIVRTFVRGDRKFYIADRGERKVRTKLYPVLTTPLKQMADFGLGYGVYFSTLRAFAFLSLFAGIINLPNILYYASTEYDSNVAGRNANVSNILQGSAICTDRTFVPCPTCREDQFRQTGSYEKTRYLNSTDYRPSTPEEGALYLNITNYVDWSYPGLDYDLLEQGYYFEEEIALSVVTNETYSALQEDYGIVFLGDGILVGDVGLLLPCNYNCVVEYVACTYIDCFLNVTDQAPYADTDSVTLHFALKHRCNSPRLREGLINLLTVAVFIMGAVVIRFRQNKLVVEFDEDEQTSQDYSIVVQNPPADAHDPQEWKDFFESNFDCAVTVCTVGVDNDKIVKHLVKRRELRHQLEMKLPPNVSLGDKEAIKKEADKEAATSSCLDRLTSSSIKKLCDQLEKSSELLKTEIMKAKDLPTSHVFVTFETERGQREVLTALSVGSLAVFRNDKNALKDQKHAFRGERVLKVMESEEPSTIRWLELNESDLSITLSILVTTIVTFVLVAIGGLIILVLYSVGLPFFASIVTTLFTSTFPTIAKMLMNFERHRNESSRQKWMFIKIGIYNILITTVLISAVNPFTATLDFKEGSLPGLIPAIHALFISQLGISPIMQLADIGGTIKRHLLGPRAKTQDAMNLNFRGTEVYLAERYANLVKFLYLMLWYCVIYPPAFFMGFCALMIVYFTDRFSLMRSWERTPQLGTQISDFARNYFIPAAIALMAAMSAYAWSGFPYDNLCEDEGAFIHPGYFGEWFVTIPENRVQLFGFTLFVLESPKDDAFEVSLDSKVYRWCNQDFRSYFGRRSFPPFPRFQDDEWMSTDQEQLLEIYGIATVLILVGVIGIFLFRAAVSIVEGLTGTYVPHGKDQGVAFSDNPTIDSYMPQVSSNIFPFPLLLCDIKDVDPKLFNWQDPDKPHSYYDVTRDAREFLETEGIDVEHHYAFTRIKHWPPPTCTTPVSC